MKNYIAVEWISGASNIGVVLVDTGFGLKAYIHTVSGIDEKEDIQHILDYGTQLTKCQAFGFFPKFVSNKTYVKY